MKEVVSGGPVRGVAFPQADAGLPENEKGDIARIGKPHGAER